MGKRNFVVDSATSLGASANGTAIPVDKNQYGFSVQAVISGASSPVGTYKIQASIDAAATPTNWSDVNNTTVAVSDNVNILHSFPADHNYRWVRTVYTRTSGSASMTTTFNENE